MTGYERTMHEAHIPDIVRSLKSISESFLIGQSTKKSYTKGELLFSIPINTPPPNAPVNANSDDIDTKTAPIAASNAFPPNFKISSAARLDSMEPVEIFPYFFIL